MGREAKFEDLSMPGGTRRYFERIEALGDEGPRPSAEATSQRTVSGL